MTKDLPEMVAIEDLPTAFQHFDLSDASMDASHLVHMLSIMEEVLQQCGPMPKEILPMMNRLGAAIWVFRDMCEALQWKLERLEVADRKAARTN